MRSFLLTLIAVLLLLPLQVKSQTLQDIFVTRADDLAAGNTATVKELARLTAATREPQTKAILEAWIAGDIHFRKSDNLIEWTKLEGEITRTIPIPDGKNFYRFALDK